MSKWLEKLLAFGLGCRDGGLVDRKTHCGPAYSPSGGSVERPSPPKGGSGVPTTAGKVGALRLGNVDRILVVLNAEGIEVDRMYIEHDMSAEDLAIAKLIRRMQGLEVVEYKR